MALDFVLYQNPNMMLRKWYSTVQTYTVYTPQSYLCCNVCVTYGDTYCLYSSHINISTVCMADINNRVVTVSKNNKKPSWSEQNVHLEPQKMLTMRKNNISKYHIFRRHKELTWFHSKNSLDRLWFCVNLFTHIIDIIQRVKHIAHTQNKWHLNFYKFPTVVSFRLQMYGNQYSQVIRFSSFSRWLMQKELKSKYNVEHICLTWCDMNHPHSDTWLPYFAYKAQIMKLKNKKKKTTTFIKCTAPFASYYNTIRWCFTDI